MKKVLASLFFLICLCTAGEAIDLQGLEAIGPVISFTKTDRAVTFNCQDKSEVQVTVLAPDLVRVRAAFKKALPERDHSWAIAKTSWEVPRWSLKEEAGQILISTDELEIAVRRSPLIIEFRDAKSRRVINADARPMMFDPKAGPLPRRRSSVSMSTSMGLARRQRDSISAAAFANWNSDTPGYPKGEIRSIKRFLSTSG